MAAIMSTGDSAIFATGAVIANDIAKPVYEAAGDRKLSDKGLMNVTRVCVVIVAAAALLIGFFYSRMYDLLIIGFQLLFHILFFPLILGVYWKRANTAGAVSGMIVGALFIFIWMGITRSMFPEPEWLSTLGPGTVGGIVMVIVSLVTQKANPPRPLTATDGTVLKWQELAK
jgi:sodium/proline symporter